MTAPTAVRVAAAVAATFAVGCTGLGAQTPADRGDRLLAQAELLAAADPGLALALARAGAALRPGPGAGAVVQRVLDRLHELHTLSLHGDTVLDARFAPDNALVITTSDDGTARTWTRDGRSRAVLPLVDERILGGAIGRGGRRAVTVSSDSWNGAGLWDLQSGSLLARLGGARAAIQPGQSQRAEAESRGGQEVPASGTVQVAVVHPKLAHSKYKKRLLPSRAWQRVASASDSGDGPAAFLPFFAAAAAANN